MSQELAVEATDVSTEDRELGEAPVKGLFFKYTFTTMVGMLMQAAMVMFEGFVIGNYLGEYGYAVCAILAPMEYVNLALGAGFSVGICTVAGTHLGSGDYEKAKKSFNQGFWLTLIITVVIAAFVFVNGEAAARFFGATDSILDGSALALRIFVVWFPFEVVGQMLCAMLRLDEKPGVASGVMGVSAIIAAAWLYFSVASFDMGVAGVAHYYGMSIGLWFVVIAYFLTGKNSQFRIDLSGLRFEMDNVRQILAIGLPSFLVQVVTTVFATVMNNELGAFGGENAETNIAVYSLINGYVLYVINMMWQCSQYGLQPIASYNLGAKNWGRLRDLVKWMLLGTIAIVGVMSALAIIFATPIYAFFTGGDEGLVSAAVRYTFPMCALVFSGCLASVMSTYYQSVEKVGLSVLMGVVRYLVITVPLLLIVPQFAGINGVWWSIPVADVLTGIVAIVFAVREDKRLAALEAAA